MRTFAGASANARRCPDDGVPSTTKPGFRAFRFFMSDDRPSKTQRKREMHDLQSLGTELVGLSEQQLASIELPERLLDAVMEAKHMTKFEAKRRQMQYIGKIMRDVDPEPIRERLAAWKAVSTES